MYIDDILVYGHDIADVWYRTKEILSALVSKGFMINLRKCKFLTQVAEIVGQRVYAMMYKPIEKPLVKLFSGQPPTTLK